MNAVVTPYPRVAAGLKPLLLLVGIAAAVAAGVSVVLWSRGPTYSLLFANLGTEDQAQVTQALDAAGIPYHMDPGSNAIQVPSERAFSMNWLTPRPGSLVMSAKPPSPSGRP